MAALLQNERERCRRGAGRTAGLLAIVVALLAQATLPHVHVLRASAGAPGSAALIAAGETSSNREALRHATPASAPEHAESRCPICKTLAHSLDVLPANPQSLAHLDREEEASAPAAPVGVSFERPSAHAPRSPPVPA